MERELVGHTFQGKEEPNPVSRDKRVSELFSQLCFQVLLMGVFFLTSVEFEGFPTRPRRKKDFLRGNQTKAYLHLIHHPFRAGEQGVLHLSSTVTPRHLRVSLTL